MEALLQKIDALKSELDGLPRKPENDVRLWQKFRLEWNYNSNHIEGNTLTYGETELLLFQDKIVNPHDAREIDEMRAHDVAIEMVRSKAAEPDYPLTENDIRELNKIILVRPFDKPAQTPDGQPTPKRITPGQYKTSPNSVRQKDGVIFEYVSPEETPIKMGELMDWYRTQTADFHPVQVAALLHYRMVRIHPFDDGNGRVCRLLMNYHLLRHGFPPVIIKSADKQHYLTALQRADAGDLEAFVKYVAEQLVWSLELAIRAAKGESVEEPEDWEKKLEILIRRTAGQEPTPKKSDQLMTERYIDTIVPIVELIKGKLKKLDKMFESAKTEIEILKVNSRSAIGADLDNIFNRKKVLPLVPPLPTTIGSISWVFTWLNYIFNGSEPFNLQCEISITFQDYSYTISTPLSPDLRPIKKNYGEPITRPEMESFANRVGAALTQQLQEKLSNQKPD